jgi:Uma2 family endonuclease
MSVTTAPPRLRPAPPDRGAHPRRWTREEYHRAADLGLFGPDERLELLDGEIIEKVTQRPLHAAWVERTRRVLAQAFGSGHYVRSQAPLVLSRQSEPEPDVVVIPGSEEDYLREHPSATDVLLLVEVSDTTLRLDRQRKRPAYARAGITEYWILNLRDCQLEVYREPSRSRYRGLTIHREGEQVSPLAAPTATIHVADLLPPAAAPAQP